MSPPNVDLTRLLPEESIVGDDQEDTRLLKQLALEAREFLESYSWCRKVCELYFGTGVGGIFAVMLAEIEPDQPDVDEWFWVVVGDLPPLYLVTDDLPTPEVALRAYISLADEWIGAVRKGDSTAGLIPVNVPPTAEWARELDSRLRFLETEILGC